MNFSQNIFYLQARIDEEATVTRGINLMFSHSLKGKKKEKKRPTLLQTEES